MPEGKVFLDTNMLIYAHDSSAKTKHEMARETVLELWEHHQGLLSTQVLQEFFYAITRKIPKPMDALQARKIVEDLCRWEVVVNDTRGILSAIDIQSRYQYSFWDALIIQAAIQGGAKTLLTEDLSHGQTIQGVKIRNPFRTGPVKQ